MRVRVLAAMTVARELAAVYVWGAQTGGARRLGVPETTITAIREKHARGIPPEDAQSWSSRATRRTRSATAKACGRLGDDGSSSSGRHRLLLPAATLPMPAS
jgi:hypothetical protein